jgi:hypothetical protein
MDRKIKILYLMGWGRSGNPHDLEGRIPPEPNLRVRQAVLGMRFLDARF